MISASCTLCNEGTQRYDRDDKRTRTCAQMELRTNVQSPSSLVRLFGFVLRDFWTFLATKQERRHLRFSHLTQVATSPRLCIQQWFHNSCPILELRKCYMLQKFPES